MEQADLTNTPLNNVSDEVNLEANIVKQNDKQVITNRNEEVAKATGKEFTD